MWEYKTVTLATHGFFGGKVDVEALDSLLNELGRERWELAAALDTNYGQGGTRDIVAIFKRHR